MLKARRVLLVAVLIAAVLVLRGVWIIPADTDVFHALRRT